MSVFDWSMNGITEIDDFELRCTCTACPEQYDVFKNGRQVGYLRLRHGTFRASVPDYDGRTVYSAHPEGDGHFENDVERMRYIGAALAEIEARIDDL